MLGRCSSFLDLEQYDPEIERTLSKMSAKKRDSKKKDGRKANHT